MVFFSLLAVTWMLDLSHVVTSKSSFLIMKIVDNQERSLVKLRKPLGKDALSKIILLISYLIFIFSDYNCAVGCVNKYISRYAFECPGFGACERMSRFVFFKYYRPFKPYSFLEFITVDQEDAKTVAQSVIGM